MRLTLKIKLHTAAEQKQALKQTMLAYNAACNFVSGYALSHKVFHNFALHTALYKTVREKYQLPSQLAVSVFSKVADAYKTEITRAAKAHRELSLCVFKKYSAVVYDTRILSYGKENVVSIKTLKARLKIPASLHKPQSIPFFEGEADLLYIDGEFYLSQTVSQSALPRQKIEDYLGVDLGMVEIATDSDGVSYSGEAVKSKRVKYQQHQRNLQKRNTKSARRRLAKVRKRESRFRKDVNHCLSRSLVEKAKRTSRGIALEELVQFFDKTRVRKSQRNQRCSWGFRQMRQYLSYKAHLLGIPVVMVPPAYTSQQCHACKHIAKENRASQAKFLCVSCRHAENADINAAKNIRYWAAVNQPIAVNEPSGL